MVGKCRNAVNYQQLSHFLYLFAAKAVYDSGLSGVLFYEADYVLFRLYFIPYFVVKVGAVEGRFEHPRILDPQVFEDVALHLRRSSCRQGDDGGGMNLVHNSPDAAVLRTEVVAPFRYTVSLVHRIE